MSSQPPNMSPELLNTFQQVLSGYRGGSIDDLMRHVSRQDPDTVNSLLNAVETAQEASKVDLATLNYAGLPMDAKAFWVVQLVHMGYQDRNGRVSDNEFPGSQPTFNIVIYDERNCFRVTEDTRKPGLPSSTFVLQSIQKSIASPLPPLRPKLPGFLLIARKLGSHISVLKPFLDSLPSPFSWRLETEEEEEEVANGVHAMNVAGVEKGLKTAESEKELGNKAFGRKNREQAVEHYTEALESLIDASSQKPTDAEAKKIRKLFAVCFSNRAASWLLPGVGQDPQKALDDAEKAIAQDSDYPKAYYRKAKALQLLDRTPEAVETLRAALNNSNLASDKGLRDALTEIQ